MEIMIDEVITRYKHNAEYVRRHGDLQGCLEFRQLADWLQKYQMMQADYNARLKADMVAMLEDLKLDIEAKENYYEQAFKEPSNAIHESAMGGRMFGCGECKELIQQKIDKLKELKEVKDGNDD